MGLGIPSHLYQLPPLRGLDNRSALIQLFGVSYNFFTCLASRSLCSLQKRIMTLKMLPL